MASQASQARDHRASLSPYAHSQQSRGSDSRSFPTKIIVEPTPDNQHVYNEIRQTHERLRLQTHLASQQNLVPPSAAPSISTAHSPIDEPRTPSTQDATPQDQDHQDHPDLGRRPRGRRRGPLQSDTRLKTAVKRKLKLACPHHRAKKTTCDCHDFSKLEEGYQNFLQQQSTNRRRSHDSNAISPRTPLERSSNSEMFGIGGGAAMDQEPFSNDVDILQSAVGDDEHAVRSDVQQIVSGFDSDTVLLDSTMLQAPGQTYHPGNDIGTTSPRSYPQDDLLEIGSQNRGYPNRWHCSYKGDVESLLETSSQKCSFSGKLNDLSNHFRREHHPFYDAFPRFWHVCVHCGVRVRPQTDTEPPPLRCDTGCTAPVFEKCYFGSTRTESVAESIPGLTQSSSSEAAYSSYLSPGGGQPQSGGRGSSGGFNFGFGTGSPLEGAGFYNAKWDTSSVSSDHLSECGCYPQDCLRSLARRNGVERHPSDPITKLYHDVRLTRYSHRRCPIRLLPYVKLSIGHLLSIMLPLLVLKMIQESDSLFESHKSSLRTFEANAISWWPLILLCLGFVATWTLKNQLARSRSTDKSGGRARDREHRRNVSPLMTFRYGVV
ncbi:hypothetical protein F4821DRAFT_257147 [Hypoxylon rubiginosum]|uniref:Uncharacterized protein n=1 Tax=Hypoxylon rubiginosum TaxID=110542 RepID=A0ACC0D9R9_9PEZI|nr:hypothetical protein F4821DRAFT_257147 [Hypoxylon rubiginosum]